YWMVIYNLGQAGADAYAGANVITFGRVLTVTSNGAADGISDHVNINPGFRFAFRSPNHRFFIVERPISYVCDLTARTLTRYQGYALTANQTSIDTNAELSGMIAGALIANNVAGCTFLYQPGTNTRGGLVTLSLTIQDPDTNERVRLL